MATKKGKPSTNTSNSEEPKRHQISTHGPVVSNTEYQEKILKAKKADGKKSKIFKWEIEFQDKRKEGIKASVNKKAKTTVTGKGKEF